jgi:signal peptidase I
MTAGTEVAWQRWLKIALIGRNPTRTLWRVVGIVVMSFIVFGFVLVPIKVEGISMMPTYRENNINFVNRLAYVFHKPERRDVVAIRLRAGRHIMYMKRIVGLPGETIAFHRGHLFINGSPVAEPYMKTFCTWEIPPRTLGPDEYYFVGDNRSMPAVDHTKGVASREFIVGKVLL